MKRLCLFLVFGYWQEFRKRQIKSWPPITQSPPPSFSKLLWGDIQTRLFSRIETLFSFPLWMQCFEAQWVVCMCVWAVVVGSMVQALRLRKLHSCEVDLWEYGHVPARPPRLQPAARSHNMGISDRAPAGQSNSNQKRWQVLLYQWLWEGGGNPSLWEKKHHILWQKKSSKHTLLLLIALSLVFSPTVTVLPLLVIYSDSNNVKWTANKPWAVLMTVGLIQFQQCHGNAWP